MEEIETDELVAYVVWLPVLNFQNAETLQRNAHRYEELIPGGPRSVHYTDPEGYTGKAFSPLLEIPYGAPAWDVYFAFDADVTWGESAPMPTHWEHQLGGMPPARRLDGARFAEEMKRLLAAVGD